jgi:hypothetical protein
MDVLAFRDALTPAYKNKVYIIILLLHEQSTTYSNAMVTLAVSFTIGKHVTSELLEYVCTDKCSWHALSASSAAKD